MDANLDFIRKTDLIPNCEMVGYGHRKTTNPFRLNRETEIKILEGMKTIGHQKLLEMVRSNPRTVIKTFHNGTKVLRWDLALNYRYTFDYETGYAMRSEYLDEDCRQTGEEVFNANFPHLIDVGIMGHCTHGQSGLCLKSGVQCYQDGLNIVRENMKVDDFRRIAEECKDLTNQFALGGRGDPNEHEDFEEILRICRRNNIVPNYTTSGFGLTDEQIKLTKEYCGAVAVSWYRSSYTINAIKRFVDAGVKTNIHYVLNRDTIMEAIDYLENDKFPSGINAVVFLSHKPVGLGQKEKCLDFESDLTRRMFVLIYKGGRRFKIGVDGSMVVGLINSGLDFDMKYLDTCEATRFTCYIDADMRMHPCSFDTNDKYVIDLHKYTIVEAWNSEKFNSLRDKLRVGCPECKYNKACMGGCLLHKDIILCPNRMQDISK